MASHACQRFCDRTTFFSSKLSQQSRGNMWAGQKALFLNSKLSHSRSVTSHTPLFLENKRIVLGNFCFDYKEFQSES